MNSIKNFIPNLLTLGNVVAGSLAIYFWSIASWDNVYLCFGLALFFDFFDGLTARALNATSAIGKDLDSLADMISFGVLPGLLLSWLLRDYSGSLLGYAWVLQPACAAYRLARFNNNECESTSFTGIPSPLNALFVIGVFYSVMSGNHFTEFLLDRFTLLTITIGSSILMVTSFSGLSNKFSNLSWRPNQFLYLFTIGSIILFFIFRVEALVLIYPLYIIISGFKNLMPNEVHSSN